MKTLNKVQLIGYLGADPKIYQTNSGEQYALLRLATDHFIRNNETSTKVTAWHRIKVWGAGRMEYIQNNLMKGSHVLVEGPIEYYTLKHGERSGSQHTEIKASHIMNLDR